MVSLKENNDTGAIPVGDNFFVGFLNLGRVFFILMFKKRNGIAVQTNARPKITFILISDNMYSTTPVKILKTNHHLHDCSIIKELLLLNELEVI